MADYLIQEGDTLDDIAARLGYSVEDLIAFNQIIDRNKIAAGGVIKTPPWSASVARTETPIQPPYNEATEIAQVIEAMSKQPEELKPFEQDTYAPPPQTNTEHFISSIKKLIGIEEEQKAEPLSFEAMQASLRAPKARGLLLPQAEEEWRTSTLAPVSIRSTPESKLISTAAEEESPAGLAVKFAKPLLSWMTSDIQPAVPGFLAEPAKKFGELYEGKLPTHVYNQETGEVELSPSIQRLGAESALTAQVGGLAGTKGLKLAPTARELAPEVYKWADESPRAKIIPEPKTEITALGAPGILTGRAIKDRPGAFFHTKVEEKFNLGKEKLTVSYSIANGRRGGHEADIDFGVLEAPKPNRVMGNFRPVAGKAPTPQKGRDTLFTVMSSVEKFVQQAKPERVTFIAADDKLIPLYDGFAKKLARQYEGSIIELPSEGGIATVEFPRNAGTIFDKSVLRTGLPDFLAVMAAPYVIATGVKAARALWPKNPIRVGSLLDVNGDLAPSNLMVFDKRGDILKAITSSPINGLFSVMRGLGYNHKAMYDAIEMNTMAAAHQKISNAVTTGKMRGIDGDYVVPDGLSAAKVANAVRSLPKPQQIMANDYINLRNLATRMRAARVNTAAGMTRADIQARIAAIEANFPQVKEIHKAHQTVWKATLDYAGSGNNAIFTKKQLAELKAQDTFAPFEPDAVDPNAGVFTRISQRAASFGRDVDIAPQILDKRLGLTNARRVDAFDMLPKGVETMLRARNKNAVKNNLIEAIVSTNKNAIISVTKEQLRKNPLWRDRLILTRKNGVLQRHVSSQFIADMIRMDPHFARNPWLFASSRAFQFGTTSYGNPQFALTQFLRENVLGPLSTPKGYKGIGVPFVNTSFAAFEQVARRSQKLLSDEFYRSLDSGSGGVLRMLAGGNEKLMKSWADTMAKSYLDSTYHMYSMRGGPGISMSHNPIAQARSVMDELTKNTKAPQTVRILAETYKNLFDAMQNAARYTFFKRNLKRGRKTGKVTEAFLDDITRESRHLTAELMTAGRGRTSRGVVTGDYPKGAGDFLISGYANALDLARESTVWVNATIKGMERIGRAYWENPFKFTTILYTGVFLPQVISYMMAAARGPEYLDYLVNGRSELDKASGIYFPPLDENAPPTEGWQINLFPPEIAPFNYMVFNLLHSTFGSEFGMPEGATELRRQVEHIMNNNLGLTMPPWISAIGAAGGMKIPGSIPGFGEEAYSIKEDPYSYLGTNTEMFLKAIFGSATDAYVRSLNTLLESGDVAAAMDEFVYLQKQKTPIAKGIQLHTFTEPNEKYWERKNKLDQMEELYQQQKKPGMITEEAQDDITAYGPELKLIPETRAKLTKKGVPYKSGEQVKLGEPTTILPAMEPEALGKPPLPPPTNPAYLAFSEELHKHFNGKGGNYGAAISRLSNISKQVRGLKRINQGSLNTIPAQIAAMPDDSPLKAELQQFNWSERDSVRKAINYFETERLKTFKAVDAVVREVEDKLGVKLDDLDPYGAPATMHLGTGAP